MDGYLLDANHVIPLLRPDDADRTRILNRMAAMPPDSPVCIATGTLAELEVGCCFQKGRSEAQADIRETIRANNLSVLEFTNHTAAEYGILKAALMRKYNREALKKNRAKFPEEWTSPDKGKTLGVDEFDLLVVSHAIERNLVLVTTDRMLRICDGLGETSERLHFLNWVPPQSADAT